jgi:hypothetical protein
MLTWLDWMLLLPALAWEARRGNRRQALPVAAWTVGAPVVVMVTALLAGGGDWRGQVAHLQGRLGSVSLLAGNGPASYPELLHRLASWNLHSPALLGPAATVVAGMTMLWALSCRLRRSATPVPGDGWLWGLVAYGVPCTLLFRNLATYHEFYFQLYSPAVAICAGLATTRVADWLGRGRPRAQRWAGPVTVVALLAAVVLTSTWPARGLWRPEPIDYQLRDLATTLGWLVGPDTVLIASPPIALDPGTEPLDLAHRELALPTPYVFCLTGKTAYVCRNEEEIQALLGQLPVGRDVILVDRQGHFDPLPPGAPGTQVYRFGWYTVEVLGTPRGGTH